MRHIFRRPHFDFLSTIRSYCLHREAVSKNGMESYLVQSRLVEVKTRRNVQRNGLALNIQINRAMARIRELVKFVYRKKMPYVVSEILRHVTGVVTKRF